MPDSLRRLDESPDEEFYAQPRFVTHIDDEAIAAVTRLYREYLPADGAILDLMSSWVSHLPPGVAYRRVAILGMNERELARNERATEYVVRNLNAFPTLPYGDCEFDGCGVCVSIDYLTRPVEVLREVGRVLKPNAPLVITFSNRCFPTKAVLAWHALDDAGHVELVKSFVRSSAMFEKPIGLDRTPHPRRSDPLYAVVALRRLPM
ncbi:methyltransferase domain-containing protein [Deinococcus yavapaiensis]|nr:methyltransferase domain-containing protein [Deinococcus yavapaiensis]